MITTMEPIMETSTYLPLFCENGEWIERADFMVLAALSETTQIDMHHVYEVMLREELLNPNKTAARMSGFAKEIEAKRIRGNLTQRVLAGQVVLELARLASSTGKPPTINAARRLVAFNHSNYIQKPANNRIREVEDSFRKCRASAHLQAAAVYDPKLLENIEGDDESLRKFLGIARAFEEFIDSNVVSKSFKWDPWRVPKQIVSRPKLTFNKLTDHELTVAMRG